MGFITHNRKRGRRANGGGRRIGDRMRDAIRSAVDKWTSPYATSRDLTEHEILTLWRPEHARQLRSR
jgi:hypothetical protein